MFIKQEKTKVLIGNKRQHKDRWIAHWIQFTKVGFLCYELNKQMSLGTNDNNFLLQAVAQNNKVAWLISFKLNFKIIKNVTVDTQKQDYV